MWKVIIPVVITVAAEVIKEVWKDEINRYESIAMFMLLSTMH